MFDWLSMLPVHIGVIRTNDGWQVIDEVGDCPADWDEHYSSPSQAAANYLLNLEDKEEHYAANYLLKDGQIVGAYRAIPTALIKQFQATLTDRMFEHSQQIMKSARESRERVEKLIQEKRP